MSFRLFPIAKIILSCNRLAQSSCKLCYTVLYGTISAKLPRFMLAPLQSRWLHVDYFVYRCVRVGLNLEMNFLILFCIGIFSLAECARDDESSGARLLVSKQILNKYLVEDMDILLKYTLHNVGKNAATNVVLSDQSFHPESFVVMGGQLSVKIDRIPPGTNATHVVVIRPQKYGYYNFTSAEVSYKTSEEDDYVQYAVTSEPGEGLIVAFRDYDKKFSSHVLDWAAFAIMTLPSLVIPFILWYSSKSKYEQISKKTK